MQTLSKCPGVTIFTFHQCVYEQVSRKPTRMVLLNMQPFIDKTRALGCHGYCNHGDAHRSLLGTDEDGNYNSAPSKIYTPAMCSAISRSARSHLVRLRSEGYIAQSEELPPDLQEFYAFTDFYGEDAVDQGALRHQPGINLVYGAPGDPLPPADLIILPGSKNVRADMQWLREQGWDTQIMKHLRFGGKVLGICGGYQMLGQNIHDPDGIEDSPGTTEGLGLLPCSTELKGGKQLLQVAGTVLGDAKLRGYEIHCGETRIEGALEPIAQLADGRSDGAISEDGRVAGTYIHGLFDQPEACHALLKWAGCDTGAAVDVAALRNTELDRLAGTLEHHLDLAALWRAAGIA